MSYADESEGFVTAHETPGDQHEKKQKKKKRHHNHSSPRMEKHRLKSGSECEPEEKYPRHRSRQDRREKKLWRDQRRSGSAEDESSTHSGSEGDPKMRKGS